MSYRVCKELLGEPLREAVEEQEEVAVEEEVEEQQVEEEQHLPLTYHNNQHNPLKMSK